MCGVFGFVLGRPLSDDDAVRGREALTRLSHRGPDGIDVWIDRQRGVFLGHTRLAIIDLREVNAQPMAQAGDILTFNGELYNFGYLRQALEGAGHRFATRGDTEVLLRSWQEWGPSALDRFDGMFAFALYDRDGSLHLVTDPFGEKPLYVARAEDGYYFASEPHVLIELLGLPFAPTSEELTAFLLLGFIPAPATGYKALEWIPPATHITIEPDLGRADRRYWTPPVPQQGHGRIPRLDEATIDRIRDALLNSLERRVLADVPVGVFLSSGTDSALVTALVKRELGRDLLALTVAFPDGVDESADAAAIASHLELPHRIVEAPGGRDADPPIAASLIELYGVPNDNTTAISIQRMSELAREHMKVALSGLGGDELFYGYGRHTFAYEHRRAFRVLPAIAPVLSPVVDRLMPDDERWRRVDELFSGTPGWRYIALKNQPAGPLLRQLPGAGHVAGELVRDARLSMPLLARDVDLRHVLPGSYIPAVDRGSMRASLEVRTPFLSRELLAAVSELDQRVLLHHGQKALLRRLLSRYLPEELVAVPKRGFVMPSSRATTRLSDTPPDLDGLPQGVVNEVWKRRSQGHFGQLSIRFDVLGRLLNGAHAAVPQ